MASKKKIGAKQGILPGTPEPDEVGKAAEKYLSAVDDFNEAKDDCATKAGDLVALMRQHKRNQIRVNGKLILCKHLDAQDVLKVKKVKEG
jgi:hypothetical protein